MLTELILSFVFVNFLISSCIRIKRQGAPLFKLFNLFKKNKDSDKSAPVSDAIKAEPVQTEAPKAEPSADRMPTQTTIKRDAPKKTYGATETKKLAVRKTAEKKPAETKTDSKKASEKKSSETKTSAKKTIEKKPAAKKTAEKKEPAKSTPGPEAVPGMMPKVLKGFEKELKEYAQRSRMEFNSKTSNAVFTEYMSMIFRGLGYKMVMIRDAEEGIITMLDKADDPSDDSAVRSKLVVKCVYSKRGSVGVAAIVSAQEAGAANRSDSTWCITTTDFDPAAVRKSKKQDAKVKLYDGQKLHKEFLSMGGSGW